MNTKAKIGGLLLKTVFVTVVRDCTLKGGLRC
jgi:hypothetical protein